MEVRTLRHAVHSGMYGGAVPDALTALCRLLATLHDERGDVAVPGLVAGPADALDLTEAQLRADAGLLDGVQLIGTGALTERLWTRPAIAVIGIDAPSVDRRRQHARARRPREGEHAGGARRRRDAGAGGAGSAPRVARAVGRAA